MRDPIMKFHGTQFDGELDRGSFWHFFIANETHFKNESSRKYHFPVIQVENRGTLITKEIVEEIEKIEEQTDKDADVKSDGSNE